MDEEYLIETYQKATQSCKFDEIKTQFLNMLIAKEPKPTYLSTVRENATADMDLLCWKNGLENIIPKIASTLSHCVDPNYLNHVKKMISVASNLISKVCESQEEFISSTFNLKNIITNCPSEKVFKLLRCLFSQAEVRELINDRSLISDFTLELLDGNEKKCRALNEIQTCFVETLDECDEKQMLLYFKLTSNIILQSLHCKRHEQQIVIG